MSHTTHRILFADDTRRSLDLRHNSPTEGQIIQTAPNNDTDAQKWILKVYPHGNLTIQSGNPGDHGHGFFQAVTQNQGEPIVYTRHAWLYKLVHVSDLDYRLETPDGSGNKLALTVHWNNNQNQVILDNVQPGLDRQRWRFEPPVTVPIDQFIEHERDC